jgi:hypothetical protein
VGFWKRWLEKMAAANKQSLGDKRLDCCDLQQKQKHDVGKK